METNNWSRNVGTSAHPVSALHEYAVALIWDELSYGMRRSNQVRVLMSSGDMSSNLLDGIERIAIPDDMSPVGGTIPDIALYDGDNKPIRVIEVAVTSPTSDSKLENLTKRGVEVVEVTVKSEDDLRRLCWTPAAVGFALNARANPVHNIPSQRDRERMQYEYNATVAGFAKAIQNCAPEVRRQLCEVLDRLRSIDSLYPISPQNPKRKSLEDNASP